MTKLLNAAVLFDLDGTLLDTALDLGATANYILKRFGYKGKISDKSAREYASDGMAALLNEGARSAEEKILADDLPKMKHEFLNYYDQHFAERTVPFPGITEVMEYLYAQNAKTAIITNKPDKTAINLIKHFPCFNKLDYILGSRPDIPGKPAPDAIFEALKNLAVKPQNAIYVGDHERDMEAASRAGVTGVCAGWGYLHFGTNPSSLGGKITVNSPRELKSCLVSFMNKLCIVE